MRFKHALLVAVILIFLANAFFFSISYFDLLNGFSYSQFLLPYVFIALASWVGVRIHIAKKILLICGTFIIGVCTGAILLFSTMFLPGSKEHNYVMYRVCLPALDQYYETKGEIFSLTPNEKSWQEHSICEQNVRDGKDPLENIRE